MLLGEGKETAQKRGGKSEAMERNRAELAGANHAFGQRGQHQQLAFVETVGPNAVQPIGRPGGKAHEPPGVARVRPLLAGRELYLFEAQMPRRLHTVLFSGLFFAALYYEWMAPRKQLDDVLERG